MNKRFNVDSCHHAFTFEKLIYSTQMHMILHIKFLTVILLSLFLLSTLGDPAIYLSDQVGFLFSAKAAIPEGVFVRSDRWKKKENSKLTFLLVLGREELLEEPPFEP